MKVLIACEFSGIVRDAFIAKGHDAVSCDLLPTERPGPHIQGDAMEVLDDGWDMMIAHPDCRYLTNSGVRWLYEGDIAERWKRMVAGAVFYRKLREARIPKKCLENPIMHPYARQIIGEMNVQYIQPHQFGHGETKATGLDLIGLPPLVPTKKVKGRDNRVHREPPGPDRWKNRSRTLPGIAAAMAEQWG